MKYEVTIVGTLPTFLNYENSEDCIQLACVCIEDNIKAYTKYAYESVEASYEGDGNFTITIRKIITRTEPPTVGEMEDDDRRSIGCELIPALLVTPFATRCNLHNLAITDVKPVLED